MDKELARVRLAELKKQLVKKQQKLQKCERKRESHIHVKQKLKEQAGLQNAGDDCGGPVNKVKEDAHCRPHKRGSVSFNLSTVNPDDKVTPSQSRLRSVDSCKSRESNVPGWQPFEEAVGQNVDHLEQSETSIGQCVVLDQNQLGPTVIHQEQPEQTNRQSLVPSEQPVQSMVLTKAVETGGQTIVLREQYEQTGGQSMLLDEVENSDGKRFVLQEQSDQTGGQSMLLDEVENSDGKRFVLLEQSDQTGGQSMLLDEVENSDGKRFVLLEQSDQTGGQSMLLDEVENSDGKRSVLQEQSDQTGGQSMHLNKQPEQPSELIMDLMFLKEQPSQTPVQSRVCLSELDSDHQKDSDNIGVFLRGDDILAEEMSVVQKNSSATYSKGGVFVAETQDVDGQCDIPEVIDTASRLSSVCDAGVAEAKASGHQTKGILIAEIRSETASVCQKSRESPKAKSETTKKRQGKSQRSSMELDFSFLEEEELDMYSQIKTRRNRRAKSSSNCSSSDYADLLTIDHVDSQNGLESMSGDRPVILPRVHQGLSQNLLASVTLDSPDSCSIRKTVHSLPLGVPSHDTPKSSLSTILGTEGDMESPSSSRTSDVTLSRRTKSRTKARKQQKGTGTTAHVFPKPTEVESSEFSLPEEEYSDLMEEKLMLKEQSCDSASLIRDTATERDSEIMLAVNSCDGLVAQNLESGEPRRKTSNRTSRKQIPPVPSQIQDVSEECWRQSHKSSSHRILEDEHQISTDHADGLSKRQEFEATHCIVREDELAAVQRINKEIACLPFLHTVNLEPYLRPLDGSSSVIAVECGEAGDPAQAVLVACSKRSVCAAAWSRELTWQVHDTAHISELQKTISAMQLLQTSCSLSVVTLVSNDADGCLDLLLWPLNLRENGRWQLMASISISGGCVGCYCTLASSAAAAVCVAIMDCGRTLLSKVQMCPSLSSVECTASVATVEGEVRQLTRVQHLDEVLLVWTDQAVTIVNHQQGVCLVEVSLGSYSCVSCPLAVSEGGLLFMAAHSNDMCSLLALNPATSTLFTVRSHYWSSTVGNQPYRWMTACHALDTLACGNEDCGVAVFSIYGGSLTAQSTQGGRIHTATFWPSKGLLLAVTGASIHTYQVSTPQVPHQRNLDKNTSCNSDMNTSCNLDINT